MRFEDLLPLAIFIGTGAILWALSSRFPLADYERPRARFTDWGYLLLALGFFHVYDLYAPQSLVPVLDSLMPFSGMISDFLFNHPIWIQVAVYTILTDFLSYWSHRLLHARRMWPIHAFHHSAKNLNWISGMRGSPIHFLITTLPLTFSALLILVTDNPAVGYFLMFGSAFIQHQIHSNIYVPYARQLEKILVTPRFHFVHHHPDPRYTNSNYGFLFTTWDRLFGTFTDPDSVEDKGKLGLDYEQDDWSLFLGIKNKNTPEELKIRNKAA